MTKISRPANPLLGLRASALEILAYVGAAGVDLIGSRFGVASIDEIKAPTDLLNAIEDLHNLADAIELNNVAKGEMTPQIIGVDPAAQGADRSVEHPVSLHPAVTVEEFTSGNSVPAPVTPVMPRVTEGGDPAGDQ